MDVMTLVQNQLSFTYQIQPKELTIQFSTEIIKAKFITKVLLLTVWAIKWA